MAGEDDAARIARRLLLRPLTAIALGLGVPILALGGLPGTEIYTDASDCFGRALGGLFAHHGGGARDCTAHYVLDHTEPVIEHPIAWVTLVALLLPGILVWLRPRLRWAALWSVWTAGMIVATFVATFDLRLFERSKTLWPAQLAGTLGAGLVLVLLVIMPIGSAVIAWKFRQRPPPPPVELPRARVV